MVAEVKAGVREAKLLKALKITSLALGSLPVLVSLGLTLYYGIVHHYGFVRPITVVEFVRETVQGLRPGLAIGGPLLLATAIAWRWPLLSGIVLLLFSVPFTYGPLASYDIDDWGASIGVVYGIVGLLYLVAWLRRKVSGRVP